MATTFTPEIQAMMDRQARENAIKAPSNPSGKYVTDAKTGIESYATSNGVPGQAGYTYNTYGKDSVFDPLGKNYNGIVANSNGKIALSDLDNSSANGFTDAYNLANNQNNIPQTTQQYQQPIYSAPQVYDPTNDINSLKAYQLSASQAGLKAANDKNLSDLSYANGKIEPAYAKQRDTVSTNSQIGAKNFAEYMSQRTNVGGANGSMAQSNIADNVALQGNLGNLATSQASDYASNAKQVGDTNVAYNNDIASSNAGIEAKSMQSLIDAKQNMSNQQLAQANADRSFNYGVGRDKVTDTGYLADGTQTMAGKNNDLNNTLTNLNIDTSKLNLAALPQQIKDEATVMAQNISKGSIDIATGTAQLKELTDPNSTTNQMAKLGLNTAKLNFAALPAQIKQQAQLIVQQLAKGSLDIKQAQIQLDYLPRQLQASINAQNASAAASGRSGRGGSSGGMTPTQQRTASATENKNAAYAQFNKAMSSGNGSQWLISNAENIITTIGESTYYDMEKKVSTEKNYIMETMKDKANRFNSSPQ